MFQYSAILLQPVSNKGHIPANHRTGRSKGGGETGGAIVSMVALALQCTFTTFWIGGVLKDH